MLYFSIPLSLLVLVGAHIAARPHPHRLRTGVFVGCALLAVVSPMCLFVFPTVTIVLVVLLFVALQVWRRARQKVRTFLPLSAGAAVIAYGVAFLISLGGMSRYDGLRQKYPYESMDDRVPAPRRSADSEPLREPATTQLASFESEVEPRRHSLRTRMLRQLHEDRVRLFANSPGFGVARILEPGEWGLKSRPGPETPEQPGSYSPASKDRALSAADEADLLELHAKGSLDFVNPAGFGFVKDRGHVAGFLPHRFSEVPTATPRWDVERIELVGMLLHPEPVAYVSDRLPEMSQVRDVPTRPLDEFETSGLVTLRRGGTLVVASADRQARILGALRSARQCVECHGGQRGDLLGAFSYTLRPAEDKR